LLSRNANLSALRNVTAARHKNHDGVGPKAITNPVDDPFGTRNVTRFVLGKTALRSAFPGGIQNLDTQKVDAKSGIDRAKLFLEQR